MAGETKRIKLLRSIVLGGGVEGEEGEVHEVSRALAHQLIGEGSAEHHLEEGEEPETGPTTVDRMERPGNADPKSRRISGPPAKAKDK